MNMKIVKYLGLVLIIAAAYSCTKNVVEYDAESIVGAAEFQLHYYNPVTTASTNNINKIEVNDKLYGNIKAPLVPYDVVPKGAVGRFFAVTPGTVNLKLYQGANDSIPVYDTNVVLVAGKQNIFVHDFKKLPLIFENGYPYPRNLTEKTDSICWIKFYNLLYENFTAGPPIVYNPTTLRLQYQYIDYRTSQPVNIGPPVAFGETTGWQPVTVVKDNLISPGSRLMTFKIKTVDAGGNIIGDLSVMGTGGTYSAYTSTFTCAIARRYHQIISGYRAVASPNSSVRTFTAL
jgi:hypothetical protein